MTDAHIVKRQLDEAIAYPAHDPRTESAEYKAVHHHLVYELNEPCWICGITHDAGGNMETHHAVVEWALANAVDPKKIMADWPAMGEATDETHGVYIGAGMPTVLPVLVTGVAADDKIHAQSATAAAVIRFTYMQDL